MDGPYTVFVYFIFFSLHKITFGVAKQQKNLTKILSCCQLLCSNKEGAAAAAAASSPAKGTTKKIQKK